jgi:hypothetical protein
MALEVQETSINEVLFNPGLTTVKETTVLFEGKYNGNECSLDTRVSFFDSDGSPLVDCPETLSHARTHTHTHTTSPDDYTQYAFDVGDRQGLPAHYHGPPYSGCHL